MNVYLFIHLFTYFFPKRRSRCMLVSIISHWIDISQNSPAGSGEQPRSRVHSSHICVCHLKSLIAAIQDKFFRIPARPSEQPRRQAGRCPENLTETQNTSNLFPRTFITSYETVFYKSYQRSFQKLTFQRHIFFWTQCWGSGVYKRPVCQRSRQCARPNDWLTASKYSPLLRMRVAL